MVGNSLTDPYATAAFVMAALMRYEQNQSDCFEMLDWLKGPENLSGFEKSQINERLENKKKFYKVRSFFNGATPDNDYTPTKPLKLKVSTNSYSFTSENWGTLHYTSGGADSQRPVRLRKKPSTGEWFLVEIVFLADIRAPKSDNPWY